MSYNIQPNLIGKADIIEDREGFIVAYSKGKRVLHVGCVGTRDVDNSVTLHEKISSISKTCVGIDLSEMG